MRHGIASTVFSIALCFSTSACSQNYGKARCVVRVLDEEQKPIGDADVTVSYRRLKTMNPWDGYDVLFVKGKSDKNGLFEAERRGLAHVGIAAKKRGYYQSVAKYEFQERMAGKWQPWAPTITLRLRRKIDPIPMYARKCWSVLPSSGPVGYDLLAGDWVEPAGKGEVSDLVFTLERDYRNANHFDVRLTIEAAGPGNGFAVVKPEDLIPESKLKVPHTAYPAGYNTSIVLRRAAGAGEVVDTIEPDAQNFLFRTRSETDEEGKVVKGLYGKMKYLKWWIHYLKTARLRFDYYVNPTGSRNIEFGRNLFTDLEVRERLTYE